MASIKRAVQSAFLDAGLTLEKEALNAFVTFVEDNKGGEDLIYQLLDACTKGVLTSGRCIRLLPCTKATKQQADYDTRRPDLLNALHSMRVVHQAHSRSGPDSDRQPVRQRREDRSGAGHQRL